MLSKEKIYDSIKYVVYNSKFIKVNEKNIDTAAEILKNTEKFSLLDNNYLDANKYSEEEMIIYLILYESLNFCFWDSNTTWNIEYNNKYYSGTEGLFVSIIKSLEKGHNLLNVEVLENITIQELDDVFKGNISIPLLKDRYEIIKSLTKKLKDINIVSRLIDSKSDVELLNSIVNNLSSFKDVSIYKDREIYFFNKANLLVSDLISNINSIKENIHNYDNILGCASYRLAQVLKELGILEYPISLESIIDSKLFLKHDSEVEIEIRANSLYAIELIRQRLNEHGIFINSKDIDRRLWLLSKNDKIQNKTYHLTKTIYY